MSARELWKRLPDWRAFGPYLLIELILPGGTLVAFLLWLSQRFRNLRIDRVHRAPKDYHHAVVAPQRAAPVQAEALEAAGPCRHSVGPAAKPAPCKGRWPDCAGAAIA